MSTQLIDRQRNATGKRSVGESLSEYGRGIAGGLIFSMPLLYTMEVWELGVTSSPLRLGVGLLATLLLLIGYNRYGGLRSDASFAEVLIDSVEELGLGLLLSALVLWLIGAIEPQLRPGAAIGAIVLEGMLAGIGVSVGTAQLGSSEDTGNEGAAKESESLLGKTTLGICGAVLIATNVAPTEEVMIIAAASRGRLIGLMLLAITLTAVIAFYSDFIGTRRPTRPRLWEVVRGTAFNYALALLVSAAILWFFGRLEGATPHLVLSRVVVLSVPAALGASAGRLLLQNT
jgi:putative integral membrane protein (TIGR02587 family)